MQAIRPGNNKSAGMHENVQHFSQPGVLQQFSRATSRTATLTGSGRTCWYQDHIVMYPTKGSPVSSRLFTAPLARQRISNIVIAAERRSQRIGNRIGNQYQQPRSSWARAVRHAREGGVSYCVCVVLVGPAWRRAHSVYPEARSPLGEPAPHLPGHGVVSHLEPADVGLHNIPVTSGGAGGHLKAPCGRTVGQIWAAGSPAPTRAATTERLIPKSRSGIRSWSERRRRGSETCRRRSPHISSC